jgi:hypothetical protein
VIVLDENVPASQRQLLQGWRMRPRQVGVDVGRRGLADSDIVKLLLRLRRPTFFTRDDDFYAPRLVHEKYCPGYLAVEKHEVAYFVRRLMRYPALNSQARRMGLVVRVSTAGLSLWRLKSQNEKHLDWQGVQR